MVVATEPWFCFCVTKRYETPGIRSRTESDVVYRNEICQGAYPDTGTMAPFCLLRVYEKLMAAASLCLSANDKKRGGSKRVGIQAPEKPCMYASSHDLETH